MVIDCKEELGPQGILKLRVRSFSKEGERYPFPRMLKREVGIRIGNPMVIDCKEELGPQGILKLRVQSFSKEGERYPSLRMLK